MTSRINAAGPPGGRHRPDISILIRDLRGGGAERVSVTLARAFRARGFTVEFVLRQAIGELLDEVPDDIGIHDLNAPRVRDALSPLTRYLRDRRPRAVLAAMWPITSLAIWARGLSGVRCRVVTSDHNILTRSRPGRPGLPRLAMTAAMRASYPLAEGIVGVSAGVADDIATLSGLPRDRVGVIHNPITPLPPAGAPDPGLVARWKAGDGPHLVTVGSFKPVKDHETLLRGLAELRKRTDARLLLLGDGDGRSRIEALISDLGLSEGVTLGGFQTDPHAYVALADAFVLSSRSEGFGNVLVEALACGTPVVSTDCPTGPREILDHGRFGRMVPVGDPGALAEAILETMIAPPDPHALRRRSEDFSTERAVSAYLDLLGLEG